MNELSKIEPEVNTTELLNLTAEIVANHVSHNPVAKTELPEVIKTVYATLHELSLEKPEPPKEEQKPAVPIKKSVHDDYIICLEDGKQLKMLKRHLKSNFNMSPEEYRKKWNLPADYPMVAPSYTKKRQDLAKKIGLGRNRAK